VVFLAFLELLSGILWRCRHIFVDLFIMIEDYSFVKKGDFMSNASLVATLGFIQETIKRMAANSLFIKGWCISLSGIVVVLGKKEYESDYLAQIFLGLIVFSFFFSLLDAYYLNQERIFRNEYNRKVSALNDVDEKNSLTIISVSQEKIGFFKAYFSVSVFPFYALVIGVGYFIARGCL
jgi:hypothetical protein